MSLIFFHQVPDVIWSGVIASLLTLSGVLIAMSKTTIPMADTDEANILQSIAVSAFKGNFENYGHYPP
jgi:hypothetical protein